MYTDPNMEQGPMLDKNYVLTGPIKAMCCDKILQPGEAVNVRKYTSKNRLLVKTERGFHKIKRSALNRAGKEV